MTLNALAGGDALAGGFHAPPTESAQVFRGCLAALSRPGTIMTVVGALPPAPLSVAAGSLALTLLDGTTPVHLAGALDCAALRDWLTFHTGAPIVGVAEAVFAFGTWDALQPVTRFAIGTAEYPDRAATLVIECATLTAEGPRLSGPGIKDSARLSLPETAAFQANRALFPLGFDAFFTAGDQIAGLPRSTIVEDV
jgi:alpha-D-ribose 1-methylphosphonate 5-triphosphate synthase subunit PhnH